MRDPTHGSLSILIAEDSRTQAEQLRFILENNGYEVRLALNGREALAMLAEQIPELVISDINMPEMDGYELCTQIKSDRTLAEIPVILVTALSETRDLLQGLECGADSYITKPYDEADLIKGIKQVVEGEKLLLENNSLMVPFHGESYRINNNASNILNFLITTYDLAVKKNIFLAAANVLLYDEIAERKSVEERILRNNEFLTILHKISIVASETIELDLLIPEIMKAVTVIGMLKCEPKGTIFLAGEDGLHLACGIGHSQEFKEKHRLVPYGTCLCGLSAKTGEVVISMNSETDSRHTLQSCGMDPHGHIIIPLKAKNRLVGVLSLSLALEDIQLEIDSQMSALLAALGQQVGLAIDNARLYEQTRISSLHDPLTGIANRRMMEILLNKQFSLSKRNNNPLSLLMFDIDHFKRYNDTMGHVEGDKVLVVIAQIAAEEIRETDTVFRYGGEEFLILLPGEPLSSALVIAERLRSAVERQTPVTISLGAASYVQGMEQIEEFVVKTDDALYRAKQNGRNRVES
ncbi:MAG: diguanylate cyclase [Proteobacteria bacterium]|nr:diguanylate cyclase [Pseudomonadota bacterium]MBU1648716.1 diguanylate cyclase [Pseudomonadota bacterium]